MPKPAEPSPPEPVDDATLEERARQAALREQQLQAKQASLQSVEVCGRRLVEEMEAVDRKFISMDKAGGGAAQREEQCNALGRFYVFVKILPGNRAVNANTLELVCSGDDTVNDLKALIVASIRDTYCPPPDTQRLSLMGTAVEEGTLESNKIVPNSMLHLTFTCSRNAVGAGPTVQGAPPVRVRG